MKQKNEDPKITILRFVGNVLSVIIAGTAFIYSMIILSKIPVEKKPPVKQESKVVKIDSNNYKPKNKK